MAVRSQIGSEQPKSTFLSICSEARRSELLERYGRDSRCIVRFFGPNLESRYCGTALNVYRCCTEPIVPTCGELQELYGDGAMVVWLSGLIFDLCEYVGARDKPSPDAIRQCAEVLLYIVEGFKATEVLLFFHRCKAGAYGRFYGAADLQQLCSWWHDHWRFINRVIGSRK